MSPASKPKTVTGFHSDDCSEPSSVTGAGAAAGATNERPSNAEHSEVPKASSASFTDAKRCLMERSRTMRERMTPDMWP